MTTSDGMADPPRVLLVDDRLNATSPLADVADANWCQLVIARSTYEAVLALLREDFAAIVVDVRMPDLLGFERAALINGMGIGRTHHVPMLFMTADGLDARTLLRGFEVGAVDYIQKPIDQKILRAKLAELCELFHKGEAPDRPISESKSNAEPAAALTSLRALSGSPP